LFLDDEKLEVKIKFFKLSGSEEEDEQPRLRMRFIKKRGDISKWYDLFNDLKDTVFEDTLLSNKNHLDEDLTNSTNEDSVSV